MISSLLIAAPAAIAIGLGTMSWLRRSPQSAVRRLVVLNLAVGAGAIVILGAMAFGLVDPAQAAGSTASTHSGSAFIGAGIAIAGSALGAGLAVSYTGAAALAAAWEQLSDDVACLVLTRAAHTALAARLCERPDLVWAVVPD